MTNDEINCLIEDYINLYYKKHILRIYKKASKRKKEE